MNHEQMKQVAEKAKELDDMIRAFSGATASTGIHVSEDGSVWIMASGLKQCVNEFAFFEPDNRGYVSYSGYDWGGKEAAQ